MVIASGEQISNEVPLTTLDRASVYSPSALTGVATIQVTPDGTNWYDVNTLAIDSILNIDPALAEAIRVSSGSAEAADRIFPVHGSGPNHA